MTDRFVRQASLVPADKLATHHIYVVGCGAVGRQVGLFLASMGAKKVTLFDFDIVEDVNITTQGYRPAQLGMYKVDALKADMHAIDPSIEITTHARRWRDDDTLGTAAFMCVDRISVRQFIWGKVVASGDVPEFLGDARTLGEIGKVVCVGGPELEPGKEHYGNSFFREEDAEQGLCTARLTIYSAAIAAGMLCHQFTRHLRDIPLDHEVQWSLLASMMDVPQPKVGQNAQPEVENAQPVA